MRKKLLLSVALIAGCSAAFYSCTKIASVLAQSISWQGIDITVDVPITSDTLSYNTIGTGTFTFNLDSFIKDKTGNALGLSNVDEFKFKSCTLTILDPDATNNFGNFEKAKASFFTSANTTSVLLGEVENNPATYAETLSVPINNTTNLKPYLPNSGPVTIVYDLSGKLRTPTTKALTVQAHIEYDLHVTP